MTPDFYSNFERIYGICIRFCKVNFHTFEHGQGIKIKGCDRCYILGSVSLGTCNCIDNATYCMKILDVHIYRDGGTKLIITDEGNYWIKLDGKVVKKDVEVPVQKIIELLDMMCHDAQMLHWIKRHINNNGEETIQIYKTN